MQLTKNHGRQLGLLYLASAIAGGAGTTLRAFPDAESNTSSFLNGVYELTSQMNWAITLDMIGSLIALGLTIFLFPLIRNYSKRLAIAYVSLGIITFCIISFSNVLHILLLDISASYTDNPEASSAVPSISAALYNAYYWVHFVMLMLYSIEGIILAIFFLKSKVVPKWLAFWGILASLVVFLGGALQIADMSVSMYFFFQNGIYILFMIGWLLIKGFRTAA